MIIVVMGVSGSGKTTVGLCLAQTLGWPFFEGDQYHPAANITKMAQGNPLTDADRLPWLQRLAKLIQDLRRSQQSAVIACSALTEEYRQILQGGSSGVKFVHLTGQLTQLRDRLTARPQHFMPASLLESQLELLEPPQGALTFTVDQSPTAIVARICDEWQLPGNKRAEFSKPGPS